MRGAFVLAVSGLIGFAASLSAHEKIRTAQTSATTTCMMGCNSQYANCQSSCFDVHIQLHHQQLQCQITVHARYLNKPRKSSGSLVIFAAMPRARGSIAFTGE